MCLLYRSRDYDSGSDASHSLLFPPAGDGGYALTSVTLPGVPVTGSLHTQVHSQAASQRLSGKWGVEQSPGALLVLVPQAETSGQGTACAT